MSSWIQLATTSYGSALDPTKMFWPVTLPRKSHFKAAAKMRAVKLENESCGNIGLESAKGSISQEKAGDALTNNVQIIVGADVELSVTHTRVVTAAALGVFASRLQESSMHYVIDPLTNALTSLSGVQRQVPFDSNPQLFAIIPFHSFLVLLNLIINIHSGSIYGSYFLVQRD